MKIKKILLDILRIGKICYFKEKNINNKILAFVNDYGPLGFMNSFAYNDNYLIDGIALPRSFTPITRFRILPTHRYISHFFPTFFENEEAAEKQEQDKKTPSVYDTISRATKENKAIKCFSNEILTSSEYSEQIRWIAEYCEKLYSYIYGIFYYKSSNKDELYRPYAMEYELKYDEFDPMSYYIQRADAIEKAEYSALELTPKSLKAFIDFLFMAYATNEEVPIRICKYCYNAFIPENIRSEFCSPNCRNKYHVYRNRKKKEHKGDNL